MKVSRTSIVADDLIFKYLPSSYKESFYCEVPHCDNLTADDLQVDFWTDLPKWIGLLFRLRNWLVKPFGLKHSESEVDVKAKLIECIRSDESFDMMSIPCKSEDETIFCLTDTHLTMYFSIRRIENEDNFSTIKYSTVVQFHNKLGFLYFYTILPFHYIIILYKIKRQMKKLF
ncbi:DUF2867 domain-containing protein [Dysgonomonas sp. ZJ709]|uniref:DUF2867 domain-containing protein n=1 Tax=Dysgonomonas sp. ZJ709 TaxID=2709797 RepID=UPI0013EE162A|nr:DUF2867 domain-containing protein [Dysgonomonas sp. ZJ709]